MPWLNYQVVFQQLHWSLWDEQINEGNEHYKAYSRNHRGSFDCLDYFTFRGSPVIQVREVRIPNMFFKILIYFYDNFDRGTLIHKARVVIVDGIFEGLIRHNFQKIDNAVFSGNLTKFIFSSELKYAAGWSVPVLFLSIFITAVDFFLRYTYPVVQSSFSRLNEYYFYSIFEKYFIVIPSILINLISFTLSVWTNPGSVTKLMNSSRIDKLKLLDTFPYDNLIFFDPDRASNHKSMECYTCHVPKLARSKHCSTCNDCFLLLDHHCIWVNNCIGYYNYRYFLSFLVSILWIFLYGGYLCYSALKISLDDYRAHLTLSTVQYNQDLMEMIKEKSLSGFDVKRNFQIYWKLITRTTINNETSGIILILCIALFPMVFGFLVEHIRFIYLGVTTNESVKWGYINELLKQGLLYKYEPYDKSSTVVYLTYERSTDGVTRYFRLSDESVFNDNGNGKLTRVRDWDGLDNIYDLRFWNNLKSRMFPVKFYK